MSTNFITLALSASLQIFTWDTKQLAYFESDVSTNFTTPAQEGSEPVAPGERAIIAIAAQSAMVSGLTSGPIHCTLRLVPPPGGGLVCPAGAGSEYPRRKDMAMKLVKKTAEYSIYQRGDDRYAVKDADKNPVNGDEKARILAEEGLIKLTAPAAPAEEPAEEEAAAEEAGEEAAAEEAGEEEKSE